MDITELDLDHIEAAFKRCRATHRSCCHSIPDSHLVQDLGPLLIADVRRLRVFLEVGWAAT